MQTDIPRCAIGAILISCVVGGLAYSAAENRFEAKEQKLEELAERACLDLGPPKIRNINDVKAATTLLDLCNFAHGALIEHQSERVG